MNKIPKQKNVLGDGVTAIRLQNLYDFVKAFGAEPLLAIFDCLLWGLVCIVDFVMHFLSFD
jgi:hypothetical protein